MRLRLQSIVKSDRWSLMKRWIFYASLSRREWMQIHVKYSVTRIMARNCKIIFVPLDIHCERPLWNYISGQCEKRVISRVIQSCICFFLVSRNYSIALGLWRTIEKNNCITFISSQLNRTLFPSSYFLTFVLLSFTFLEGLQVKTIDETTCHELYLCD